MRGAVLAKKIKKCIHLPKLAATELAAAVTVLAAAAQRMQPIVQFTVTVGVVPEVLYTTDTPQICGPTHCSFRSVHSA